MIGALFQMLRTGHSGKIGGAGLITHIHQNGQKAGIYWRPGIAQEVVQANLGDEPLKAAQLNSLSFVQMSGSGSCQPTVWTPFPIAVGNIPAQSFKTFELAVNFSQCSSEAKFNTSAAYSSDLGAVAAGVIDVSVEQ